LLDDTRIISKLDTERANFYTTTVLNVLGYSNAVQISQCSVMAIN